MTLYYLDMVWRRWKRKGYSIQRSGEEKEWMRGRGNKNRIMMWGGQDGRRTSVKTYCFPPFNDFSIIILQVLSKTGPVNRLDLQRKVCKIVQWDFYRSVTTTTLLFQMRIPFSSLSFIVYLSLHLSLILSLSLLFPHLHTFLILASKLLRHKLCHTIHEGWTDEVIKSCVCKTLSQGKRERER